MRKEYKPNEKVVDYAVATWRQALTNPIYQAAVPGTVDVHKLALAELAAACESSNANKEKIDAFGVELKRLLMDGHEYEFRGVKGIEFIEYLGIDYQPDRHLQKAAEEAGLEMRFPLKTSMTISNFQDKVDFFSFSMGYGTRSVYHYLIDDGVWMITDIYPIKLGTLIEDLRNGNRQKEPGRYEWGEDHYTIVKDKT